MATRTQAMKPSELANHVFDAIVAKRFYVLPHPQHNGVITKRGRPVAKLVPYVPQAKKGGLAGSVLKEVGDPFATGERWDADAS